MTITRRRAIAVYLRLWCFYADHRWLLVMVPWRGVTYRRTGLADVVVR